MDVTINEKEIELKEHTCQQMLGLFLINVAILNAIEIISKLGLRLIYPDQAAIISVYEAYIGWLRLLIIIVLFVNCMMKMKPYDTHSPNVRKLLVLWGVILIPIQLINDMCVMLYTRMLEFIALVFATSEVDQDGKIFAMIYDMSHGFKYICIFLAILLGIVMTAEILEKRKLLLFSAAMAIAFMVAFTVFKMGSFSFDSFYSFEIGINWTSLIFHTLNTVGLFGIGMYIVKMFKKDDVYNINNAEIEKEEDTKETSDSPTKNEDQNVTEDS